MYLTFDFSHTEIQDHAYDESSNTEYKAVINCLNRLKYVASQLSFSFDQY